MTQEYKDVIMVRVAPEVIAQNLMRKTGRYAAVVDYGVPEDYEYWAWNWDTDERCFHFYFRKQKTPDEARPWRTPYDELVPEMRSIAISDQDLMFHPFVETSFYTPSDVWDRLCRITPPADPLIHTEEWSKEELAAKNRVETEDTGNFIKTAYELWGSEHGDE